MCVCNINLFYMVLLTVSYSIIMKLRIQSRRNISLFECPIIVVCFSAGRFFEAQLILLTQIWLWAGSSWLAFLDMLGISYKRQLRLSPQTWVTSVFVAFYLCGEKQNYINFAPDRGYMLMMCFYENAVACSLTLACFRLWYASVGWVRELRRWTLPDDAP